MQFSALMESIPRKVTGTIVIAGIMGIGSVLLLLGRAATPSVSFEVENGTLTTSAAKISDSTASGGSAVVFQSASPPPGGSRNPLQQPFASTSIWNMPIGSSARYVPAGLSSDPGNDPWAPMPGIDDEMIILHPTAPLTAIKYNGVAWNGGNRCDASSSKTLATVPIPSSFTVPNSGANNGAAILLPDGRTILQTQPFTRCTAGGSATALLTFPNVDLYGDGISGAHGGSRLSSIGGSIRVGELRPGQIGMRHALKINVNSPVDLYRCKTQSDCYRWPALTSDSGSVGDYGSQSNNQNTAMKMGALLAIPRTVDVTGMGLESEPGKEVAWTLQNYGAYIVDSTGGAALDISAENGPDGSMRTQFQKDYGYSLEARVNSNTPWSRDIQRIVKALNVVDNNSPTAVGGGGTPLQPLAAPIAP